MKDNVAVRPMDLLQALEERAARTWGGESGKALPDPEREAFRTELQGAQWLLKRSPDKGNAFGSIDDRLVSLMQCFLAREGTDHGATTVKGGDGFEAKFDGLDPGWVWSLHDWVKKLHKCPFKEAAAEPTDIGADFRIAVLSDWGTGLYGAPVCARTIAADSGKLDLLMHLGDVYYAGDIDETKNRFLAFWPKRPMAIHRALNGNHEMYTGGKGYFDHILPKFGQSASHFAFRNEHWLLVGLDTAYAEHDLFGNQNAWLTELAAAHPSQKIMLFSHHQPFSYFEGGGPNLVKKLNPLLTSGRVAAWYWGHEHSCTIYDRHENWKMYGRCVGHSGFPYFRRLKDVLSKPQWRRYEKKPSVPGCEVLDGPNPYVTPSALYGPNGYVTIELRGPTVHETYCDPEGAVLKELEF